MTKSGPRETCEPCWFHRLIDWEMAGVELTFDSTCCGPSTVFSLGKR